MRNTWTFGTLSLVIVAACAPTEPSSPLPAGAVPIAAPAAYAEWFQRTEDCAGLDGRFQRIQWYVVPGAETFDTDAGPKVGMWTRQGNQEWIVVAGNYEEHEMVVRHEMLHSLLGVHGHPDDYFGQRCRLTWDTWAEG